jgi:diguanylate cyclase (GGDEF)-like protein
MTSAAGEPGSDDSTVERVPAQSRDDEGALRDDAARRRDDVALLRDGAATERDRRAEDRDRSALHGESAAAGARPAEARTRAARARRDAASDRGHAARDREAGATQRTHAESDRSTARSDRGQAAVDLAHASLDGLTGVYTRSAGLLELQREVDRSHRTGSPLVLVFSDVDGLKAVNDSGGHVAGDRVLVRVARALDGQLRPYDLVIRYGGDEFLCALAGASSDEAVLRMQHVNAALAEGDAPASVSLGISDLRSQDTLSELIERADQDLYRQRSRRPLRGGGPAEGDV